MLKVFSYMVEAHIVRRKKMDIEFLLMKRSDNDVYPGIWQMITGSVIKGEKGYETAFREIGEETGLKPKKLWVVPTVNSFYSLRRDHICMVPVFVALVDDDAEIRISSEHTEYQWVDKNKAISLLAWVGQRNAVDVIYDYFINQNSLLHFDEINLKKIRL